MHTRLLMTLRRFRLAPAFMIAPVMLTACAPADATGTDRHAPTSLTVSTISSKTLASLGDTARIAVRVLDNDGQAMSSSSVRWHVSGTGVLADVGDGNFRAIGNGKATIVAEVARAGTGVRPDGYFVDALVDSVTFTVAQQAVRLATTADTAFTTIGAVHPMQALFADARGNPLLANAPSLIFASSNPAIVTVDATGRVRSMAEGSARVVVQAGTMSGAAVFTVSPRRPHTSCMVYAQRTKNAQNCITVQLTMREKGSTP